jgi:pimeloyl-ACP methyl ester carboxylesterase
MNTTIDGNFVRISVAVENQGNVDLSAQVQLLDANTGNPLWSGSTFSNQLFPAHQTTNVSYIWDTSGFAWNEDGSAALNRSVKVALWTSICKESRNKIVSVAVAPKPVILAHGIWSNASTWQQYTSFLSSIHPLWSAVAIDTMNTGGGITVGPINTYAQNANELSHFIEEKRQELHAWHVDIVAHSMGGLISRYYIDRLMPQARSDGRPIVSHLIMLGTPNLGTTCAYLPIPATVQLRPDYMLYFNSIVYHHRGVPFSVLAGDPWPVTCPLGTIFPYLTGPGDTVVSVNSAIYDVPDNSARTSTVHTHMTSSQQDFLSFVLPRLRLPPSKSPAFSTVGISPQPGAVQEGVHKTALQNDSSSPQFLVSKVVAIPPGASVDVPITVSEVITFGVTLAAPSSITSKLYDPSGSLVVSTLAGSAEANELFRSFATASPSVGSWNLRLINQGSAAMAIPVSAWVGGGATLLNLASMQPDRYGRVQITTTFTRNGKPIANATVIASIAGMDNSTYLATLFDDGLHGDGQAGDGVYSTLSVPLHATVYLVTISATGAAVTRLTSSAFEIPDGVVSLKSMYMPFIRR